MNILIILLQLIIFLISPFVLIKAYVKYDTDFAEKIKPRNSEYMLLIISSISCIACIDIMYNISANDTSLLKVINFSIIMAYLIFMSYTDQKTKLLYSAVSILMIVLQLVVLLIDFSNVKNYFNQYTWTLVLPIALLFILSIFNMIGFGDVLIYIVIALYYLGNHPIPTFILGSNIVLANAMFLVVTVILSVLRHSKDKTYPLTLYITISSFMFGLLNL